MDGQRKIGPYYQSERTELYQTLQALTSRGQKPLFCTEEELNDIRSKQEELKENPGYYGKWAKHRSLSMEEIEKRLAAGDPSWFV